MIRIRFATSYCGTIGKWTLAVDRGLGEDQTVYQFADPQFIGRSYTIEDASFYVRRRERVPIDYFNTLRGAGDAGELPLRDAAGADLPRVPRGAGADSRHTGEQHRR